MKFRVTLLKIFTLLFFCCISIHSQAQYVISCGCESACNEIPCMIEFEMGETTDTAYANSSHEAVFAPSVTFTDISIIPPGGTFQQIQVSVYDSYSVYTGTIAAAGGSLTVEDGDGGLNFNSGILVVEYYIHTDNCSGKKCLFEIVEDTSDPCSDVECMDGFICVEGDCIDPCLDVVCEGDSVCVAGVCEPPFIYSFDLLKENDHPEGYTANGDTITYTITLENTGTADLIGINVIDNMAETCFSLVDGTPLTVDLLVGETKTVDVRYVTVECPELDAKNEVIATVVTPDEEIKEVAENIISAETCEECGRFFIFDNNGAENAIFGLSGMSQPLGGIDGATTTAMFGPNYVSGQGWPFLYPKLTNLTLDWAVLCGDTCRDLNIVLPEFTNWPTSGPAVKQVVNQFLSQTNLSFSFGTVVPGNKTKTTISNTVSCECGLEWFGLIADEGEVYYKVESVDDDFCKAPDALDLGELSCGESCDPCIFQIEDHLNGNAILETNENGIYVFDCEGEYYFRPVGDCGAPVTAVSLSDGSDVLDGIVNTNGIVVLSLINTGIPAGSYNLSISQEGCDEVTSKLAIKCVVPGPCNSTKGTSIVEITSANFHNATWRIDGVDLLNNTYHLNDPAALSLLESDINASLNTSGNGTVLSLAWDGSAMTINYVGGPLPPDFVLTVGNYDFFDSEIQVINCVE